MWAPIFQVNSSRLSAIALLLLSVTFFSFPRPTGAATVETDSGASPCALGEALSKAGETTEAKKEFVKVLGENPTSGCAAEGLKKLNAPSVEDKSAEHCAIGDAFLDVNHNDDATAAYKKALEENPDSDCASSGLEDAGPSAPTDLADDITGALPTLLVFAALIVLFCYGVLMVCRWDWLKQRLVSMWIVGRHAKHALRPRLNFTGFADDAVEGHPGKPLMAQVKERLNRMRQEALSQSTSEYDLDFGNPRDEFADEVSDSKTLQTALESASEVNEQAKLVAALIKIVTVWLPIRRFAVSGSMDPPAKTGASLTLAIEEEGESETITRLTGPATPEDSKANDYMKLADSAATWIQYEIACVLEDGEWNATKAESQAVLREGLDLYHLEDNVGAKEAFEQAIVLDHTNWGAYVSLAVAEARIGGNYEKSIDRILKAIEKMKVVNA